MPQRGVFLSLEVWYLGLFSFPAFLGQAADLLISAHERF